MKCPICEKELNKYIFEDTKERIYQCKICLFTFRVLKNKIFISIKDDTWLLSYMQKRYNRKKEKFILTKIQTKINFYRKLFFKKPIKFFPILKKRCSSCKKILFIKNFFSDKNNYDKHGNICKECNKKYMKNYYKNFYVWLSNAYHTMKQRQKRKFDKFLDFDKQQLFEWIDREKWEKLWRVYVNSNYNQKFQVCIARINYNIDYNLNNLKLESYRSVCLEALKKVPMSKRKIKSRKCVGQYKNGNLVKIYPSIREAERQLNCCGSSITKVCKNKYKTHHGWEWKYL